jgi:hypothetical protein
MLDVSGEILQMTRVLLDDLLRDRHERRVDAQFAVRPQHASAFFPNGLQTVQIVLV